MVFRFAFVLSLLLGWTTCAIANGLRAGAAKVDISPTEFPVIVNGMFTERTANRVVDPLSVRALVIEKDGTRIALVVADSCMMPRELLDDAKSRAAKSTGIPMDRMLISATHTHSAPAAMGCLGSRMDPRYAASLPARIARAIQGANAALEPALAGAAAFDATGYTHNRRWIRRSDRVQHDPFGEPTVRAHMHPGHVSPDVIGPSGPVDPGFTLLSLVRRDGSPLAVYGNFSMHYYESEITSSDYFGRWCNYMESSLASERGRVRRESRTAVSGEPTRARAAIALLTQGTSGDQMWMDYSRPREYVGYDAYARSLSKLALESWQTIEHRADVPVAMRQSYLTLGYRIADPSRLAWAQGLAEKIGTRLPQTQPEIYALEQLELKRRGTTELILQAVRVGDLAITALPNEVFALTGLKLKGQSPLPLTMNVELANGAEGYIPPPEQHALGGYTTWAARTAGLETNAEPRIVGEILKLLENVCGKPRRELADADSNWSRSVRKSRPVGYWKLAEPSTGPLRNQIRRSKITARLEGRHALYLDGVDRPAGSPQLNHAIHLVDGTVGLTIMGGSVGTLSGWFWNGFPTNGAAAGCELIRGGDSESGWRLVVDAATGPSGPLKLESSAGAQIGSTRLGVREWFHIAMVFNRSRLTIFVNGVPEMESAPGSRVASALKVGGGGTGSPFQGKLDELAWHSRALSASEIQELIATVGERMPPRP